MYTPMLSTLLSQAHKDEFEDKEASEVTNNDFLVCAEGYIGTFGGSMHLCGVTYCIADSN